MPGHHQKLKLYIYYKNEIKFKFNHQTDHSYSIFMNSKTQNQKLKQF